MTPSVSSRLALALVAGYALQTAMPAQAFLGFLKKATVQQAPQGTELQQQEAAASDMLRQAQSSGKASDFSAIVKRYPFTNAAAEAAYLSAVAIRNNGKIRDAFDAFQTLIDSYRQSPRFADAVRQQYELAEEAKGGKKQSTLILVPMKLGPNETIKLYEKVIANAPFGKFAPLSQFSIAEIHQEEGAKAEAVAAYQKVVDTYPNTKEASEAQFRIGAIGNIAAKRTQDSQNFNASRDALNTYVSTNPGGERLGEARTMLSQLDYEEASRSLEIGKFYERTGRPQAAAIYYNDAMKLGSEEVAAEARERLASVSAAAPNEVAAVKRKSSDSGSYTVPAAVDLRNRSDYAGPPSPELAKLSAKPKMRSDSSFSPIPLQEPALPANPAAGGAAPETLLPPVNGAPAAPPVPPAPGAIPETAPTPGAAPEAKK